MDTDQALPSGGDRDEAGAGRCLDVRGAVYAAEPDRMILVLADAARVYVPGPGLRAILAETARRAPRMLDGLRDDTTRNVLARQDPGLCPHHVMTRTPEGICDVCGEDLFRGCGSVAGMRAELSARDVRGVPPLARRGMLAALLDAAGERPGRKLPAGWRLQCRDCHELDGWHADGCDTAAVPRLEDDLNTAVPGASAMTEDQHKLTDRLYGKTAGDLTPTGRRVDDRPESVRRLADHGRRPVIRDLRSEPEPGSIGAYRGPDRGRACPDGASCGRGCAAGACFRVHHRSPLSGTFPDDEWPAGIVFSYAGQPEPGTRETNDQEGPA